jgi:hypothetical protein
MKGSGREMEPMVDAGAEDRHAERRLFFFTEMGSDPGGWFFSALSGDQSRRRGNDNQ